MLKQFVLKKINSLLSRIFLSNFLNPKYQYPCQESAVKTVVGCSPDPYCTMLHYHILTFLSEVISYAAEEQRLTWREVLFNAFNTREAKRWCRFKRRLSLSLHDLEFIPTVVQNLNIENVICKFRAARQLRLWL